LSVLWVGAVTWLTPAFGMPQAASRGFSRRSRIRSAARWLQWGWVLAAAIRLMQHEMTLAAAAASLARLGLGLGVIIGLAGMVALCVLLERLAEWARDDHAQNLFNWAMWTIPITTALVFLGLPLSASPLLSRVSIGFSALWLIGIGLFPFALLSLSASVTLSVVHSYEHRQREQRRAERRAEHGSRVVRNVQVMDEARARRQSWERGTRGPKA
jgi:hypothetical protein